MQAVDGAIEMMRFDTAVDGSSAGQSMEPRSLPTVG